MLHINKNKISWVDQIPHNKSYPGCHLGDDCLCTNTNLISPSYVNLKQCYNDISPIIAQCKFWDKIQFINEYGDITKSDGMDLLYILKSRLSHEDQSAESPNIFILRNIAMWVKVQESFKAISAPIYEIEELKGVNLTAQNMHYVYRLGDFMVDKTYYDITLLAVRMAFSRYHELY